MTSPSRDMRDIHQRHYYFVTGRLAEPALRSIVTPLAERLRFSYSIGVMPITVAALITPAWLRKHLSVPAVATHVVLPGYLAAGLDEIQREVAVPVCCGPKDCRELPEWFGESRQPAVLDAYEIEIIAEINHAPRLTLSQLLDAAVSLQNQGADIIDIGCDPSQRCNTIDDYVRCLVDHGLKVSIDTFDPREAEQAVRAGATLVLSVNHTNREAASDWGAEVVVIPDTPSDEASLRTTVEYLAARNVPMRLDPILEPIGLGLAASLVRYANTRRDFPDLPMMMGIGNLTELTDADSAGINLMLIGICAELRIHSVLTTQVINWGRSSVRECDLARRLAHHAVQHGVPPKRLSDGLVMLRDPKLRPYPTDALRALAKSVKDNHFRIFAQEERLHLVSAGLHLSDDDPFRLFDDLLATEGVDNVDPSHAFYLGFELAKASTALDLGKQYEQDESLHWGLLTKPENHHRIARTSRHRRDESKPTRPEPSS